MDVLEDCIEWILLDVQLLYQTNNNLYRVVKLYITVIHGGVVICILLYMLMLFMPTLWTHYLFGCVPKILKALLTPKVHKLNPEVINRVFDIQGSLQNCNIICPKNQNHKNFVPVNKFEISDLPKGFQNEELWDSILQFSRLVVKIVVHSVSKDRPPDRQDWQLDVDHCDWTNWRLGSGHLWDVAKTRWHLSSCPCWDCRDSSEGRRKGWGELRVFTAKHVVFDDVEAWGADVQYTCSDPHQVNHLKGYRVVRSSMDGDTCELVAITHRKELLEEIQSQIDLVQTMDREMCDSEKLTLLQKGKYLTVIISHPHGLDKQISFGRSKHRNVDRNGAAVVEVSYVYDTATCPGSSGAPVLVVGKEKKTLRYAPHVSGNFQKNRNVSGVGQEVNESVSFWVNWKNSAVLFIIRAQSFSFLQKFLLIIDVVYIKFKRFFNWIRNKCYKYRYQLW